MEQSNRERARQAGLEKQRNIRKQNTLDTLQQDPNNLQAIKAMIKISRREGDLSEERRYLYRRLELEASNPKIVMQLMKIARANNDSSEVNKLRSIIKQMKFKDDRQIKAAIAMAVSENDSIARAILAAKLREFTKRKLGMSLEEANEQRKVIQPTQAKTLEQEMLERAETKESENPIQKARKIIYESEDILQDAETIKALLEGQDKTEATLVLAELYFHTGMKQRAAKSLKEYKRTLDLVTDRSDIRLVNQAMELTVSAKTLPHKWEEIWRTIEESKKTFPTVPGDYEEGR